MSTIQRNVLKVVSHEFDFCKDFHVVRTQMMKGEKKLNEIFRISVDEKLQVQKLERCRTIIAISRTPSCLFSVGQSHFGLLATLWLQSKGVWLL